MTPKCHTQLSAVSRARMARILQLHFETHPQRIGRHWGVSVNGVRKVWRERTPDEMAPLSEALDAFRSPVPSRVQN